MIAQAYGTALYEAAQAAGKEEQILEEAACLADVLRYLRRLYPHRR